MFVEAVEHFVGQYALRSNGRAGYSGKCPVCGYQGFTLRDTGDRLLFKSHACGCTQADLIHQFQADGLWSGSSTTSYKPREATLSTRGHSKQEKAMAAALNLWNQSLNAQGTPVEEYLRFRGYNGPIPASLRYLPNGLHRPSGQRFPIMVSAVHCYPSNEMVAIHRTFLAPKGDGKAPIEPNKMSLGPIGGGAVHITPANETLAIAEGVETALTVHLLGDIATWCALSASGMKALMLPSLPLARYVHIFADKDTNFVGQEAAEAAAKRWSLEGRKVKILTPKQWGTDFNDLLQRKESPYAP